MGSGEQRHPAMPPLTQIHIHLTFYIDPLLCDILRHVQAGLILPEDILIDAKSGVSGAGRSAKESNLYCEIAEGINSYAVGSHRHMPEIEQVRWGVPQEARGCPCKTG